MHGGVGAAHRWLPSSLLSTGTSACPAESLGSPPSSRPRPAWPSVLLFVALMWLQVLPLLVGLPRRNSSAMRSLLETVFLIFSSIATLGLLMCIHCAGCLLASGRATLPESAGSVALAVRCWTRAGWRWGTGRPRLAIAHWAVEPRPQPTRLGMLRSLLGELAWLDCTTAELSPSCLVPMTCAFLHLPFCYASACSYYCCVACLLCEAALIDPRSIEAPRTCSALWSAWHLQCAAALRLIYRIVEWHVRLSRGVPRICSDE